MKQYLFKYRLQILIGSIILAVSIFLICFYNIPRIGYSYDKNTDSYIVSKVYGNARVYTIKEEIKGRPVKTIKAKAFMNKKKLKNISLGENITKIERLAFSGCINLKTIDLSHVIEIERNAFADCKELSEINLNAKHIGGGAFMGCENLGNVTLANTKSIGTFTFSGCSIEKIILPESLEIVGNDAFDGCQKLVEIIVYSKKLESNDYILSLNQVKFHTS
ncbi:MAG: leucine-rich repeat domain-containing protein [Anaeroplasmataceae bacterium]|nr:leucine-rich repeat domain-containing protein [Anaeroplasmataceae bacterium]